MVFQKANRFEEISTIYQNTQYLSSTTYEMGKYFSLDAHFGTVFGLMWHDLFDLNAK